MLAVWSRDIIVMIKMDRLPVFIVYCLLRMEIRPNARTDYILSLLHSVLIIKITSRKTNERDEVWKLAYQSDTLLFSYKKPHSQVRVSGFLHWDVKKTSFRC